jgi:cysteinyl-tRNA synthetase
MAKVIKVAHEDVFFDNGMVMTSAHDQDCCEHHYLCFAATGKTFVNYWLHGAFLTFKGEKVSKSKGGLYTVSELEEQGYRPEHYRYLCLLTHYRKPLDFSLAHLDAAKTAFNRLAQKCSSLVSSISDARLSKESERYSQDFDTAIGDDLNLAITAGLPMPKVYVVDDPAPNAFATGRNKDHAVVCATTGLLAILDKSELEGVIAHEFTYWEQRYVAFYCRGGACRLCLYSCRFL